MIKLSVGDVLAKEFIIERFVPCKSNCKCKPKSCKGLVVVYPDTLWDGNGCPYNDKTKNGLCSNIIHIPNRYRGEL